MGPIQREVHRRRPGLLIFDVEVAVLFPWAAIFKEPGVRLLALVEILLFLGILAVGFAYVWVKGDLGWLRSPVGAEKDRPEEAP